MRSGELFRIKISAPERLHTVSSLEKAANFFVYVMLFVGMVSVIYVVMAS